MKSIVSTVVLMLAACAILASCPSKPALGPTTGQPTNLSRLLNGPVVGVNLPGVYLNYLGEASAGVSLPNDVSRYQNLAHKTLFDAYYGGADYVTVFFPGYHPDTPYHLSKGQNDLSLWQTDPQTYWARVDMLLGDIHSAGLGVTFRLWNFHAFPVLAGEKLNDFITNPNSKSWSLFTAFWTQFINRYKTDPAILFYEMFNEMQSGADLDLVSRCQSQFAGNPNQSQLCAAVGNYSTNDLLAFSQRFVALTKSLDSPRSVSSNFAMPRKAAWHLSQTPEWAPGGANWTEDTLAQATTYLQTTQAPFDIVSAHTYNVPDNSASGINTLRFGLGGSDPNSAAYLTFLKGIADGMHKDLNVGEFGDSDPVLSTNASAPFSTSVTQAVQQLGIKWAALWALEFLHPDTPDPMSLESGVDDQWLSTLRAFDQALGFPVYQAATPDLIPPSVFIASPLDGASLASAQSVFVTATDNSRMPPTVALQLDGKAIATLKAPPYLFSLPALTAGTHTLSAVATDAAGNQAQDQISGTAP